MSKITYLDKNTGDDFFAVDANEVKNSVNALYDEKQDITDPSLNTTAKTIVGAINEVAAVAGSGVAANPSIPIMILGDNLFNYNSAGIIRGKYIDSNNAEVSYASASISDYIPVLPNTAYICNKFFAAVTRNVWYTSSKAVISNFTTAGATSPANAAYVRFSLNLNSTDNIALAGIKVEIGTVSSEYTPYEYRLPEANLPATALTQSHLKHGGNLFNYLTAISGKYVNAGNGMLADSGTFFASDFIPVLPATSYTVKHSYQIVWYNAKKQYISGTQSTLTDGVVTSPAGSAFLRFSDLLTNLTTNHVVQAAAAAVFRPYFTMLDNFYEKHNWYGKKFAGIGTSISNNTLWAQNVAGYFNLAYTNCGVSGSRLATNLSDAMWQDARVNAVPADANIVTIEAGTNDWANNVPLGAITSVNTDEFIGAYNTLITKLLTRNPLYRILIIATPWGRVAGFAANGNKNANNLGPEDYAQASRDVAKKWGLPICDLQQNGGWNSLNYTSYLADDLHPNTLGYRRFSDIVIGKLIELSPRFEAL